MDFCGDWQRSHAPLGNAVVFISFARCLPRAQRPTDRRLRGPTPSLRAARRKSAGEVWRHVADQLRARLPKVAALLDVARHDVLAYMDYPESHRAQLHSTNILKNLNK
ncbi:transposase [Azospirillum thiophilum]|uniref:transposase n=1 Tax=Azospirillum thiophilum TaxID=528244 RepID=UPI003CCBC0FB